MLLRKLSSCLNVGLPVLEGTCVSGSKKRQHNIEVFNSAKYIYTSAMRLMGTIEGKCVSGSEK